ncbi:MAG: DUF2752 domain-containing protein [Anaerostipes sp.]|jgi:uncharacterized membrane protein|nr:DUF2752 domain-containing protein [Anaerostipes sp.]
MEYIFHMPCIFKLLTGLYCPVCGGTRAMLAFLHFHFVESFLCNPIFIYLVVITCWLITGWILKKLGRKNADKFKFHMWMLYLGLGILLVVFVARNVGVYAFGYDYLGDIR